MDWRPCPTSAAHDIYQERLKVQSVALFQSKEECSILKVCSFADFSSKRDKYLIFEPGTCRKFPGKSS